MQNDQTRQEERGWLLTSLRLSGEATAEELAELEEYLVLHPEMSVRLEVLQALWQGGPSDDRRDALHRHLQRFNDHFSATPASIPAPEPAVTGDTPGMPVMKKTRLAWGWPLTGVAAAVAALLFFRHQPAPAPSVSSAKNTVSTRAGSKSRVQLPDGSQVWLNADSRITYDESFRGPNREVQITGEAYFDIAKDKDHPFIIHANTIDIRVLGTSLNIRSYNDDNSTEAVLIRGSIEVTLHSSPDKKILLQPNEKLVVSRDRMDLARRSRAYTKQAFSEMTLGKAHIQEKDSIAMDVLWTKNQLAFDKETLEEVARKLERWYDMKVIIKDQKLRSTEYSGVFEHESLMQVMEALRMTGNFRYVIGKKEIIITP